MRSSMSGQIVLYDPNGTHQAAELVDPGACTHPRTVDQKNRWPRVSGGQIGNSAPVELDEAADDLRSGGSRFARAGHYLQYHVADTAALGSGSVTVRRRAATASRPPSARNSKLSTMKKNGNTRINPYPPSSHLP